MKQTILIILLIYRFFPAASQDPFKELGTEQQCDYYGNPLPKTVYTFSTEPEVEQGVDRILKPIGLVRRFKIRSSDVPNAAAVIQGEDRLILFNQDFIEKVKRVDKDWATLSIMAHEIAHHLNGHTLSKSGSRPATELESDFWSGFILANLGSSLEQAQMAMRTFGSENGSSTHPPKQSRLLAIRAGWQEWHGLHPKKQVEGAAQPNNSDTGNNANIDNNARNNGQNYYTAITTGNTATKLAPRWWSWTVYIDASPNILEQIECVEYTLHPTFPNNVIAVCQKGNAKPFALTREGWGTFPIAIRVFMKNSGRVVELTHDLKF